MRSLTRSRSSTRPKVDRHCTPNRFPNPSLRSGLVFIEVMSCEIVRSHEISRYIAEGLKDRSCRTIVTPFLRSINRRHLLFSSYHRDPPWGRVHGGSLSWISFYSSFFFFCNVSRVTDHLFYVVLFARALKFRECNSANDYDRLCKRSISSK